MKKTIGIMLVIVMCAFMFTACQPTATQESSAVQSESAEVASAAPAASASEEAAAPAKEKTMKIGVSEMFAHPFFESITTGIKEVMEPLGYEVVSTVGEFDVQKQIADVEDFVAQKVDGIFISPFDSKAIKSALEVAKKANIPLVVVDAPTPDTDLVLANVATNNYEAGVANAKQLIKDLNGKGKIVVLDSPQATSSLDRANGFVDTIKAEAPDIEIVSQQDYAAEQEKALSIMENILQGQPQVDAVFACNENGAFGAIAALEAANRLEGVGIYTVDGSADGVAMIKEGKITGIAAQQPSLIGKTAAETMVKYLEDGTVPEDNNVKVPIVYVTKDVEYTGY